jgi:EAL domain-containing protein (putative c-di-GMP-specific phosphodiesterase class I)
MAAITRSHAVLGGLAIGETLADPTGIRRLLRHYLARPVTAVFVAVPLVSALLDLGTPSLLLTLSGLAAIHLATDVLLERIGHPISPDRLLQLSLITWPAGFAVLGAAGWTASTGEFHGELIVLVGVVVAGFVGIVTQPVTAILWGVAALAALALGASLEGPVTGETMIAAASIAMGTFFGSVLGGILERFMDRRRHLLQEMNRIQSAGDPFAIASAFIDALTRWTAIRTATLTWFTEDGRSVLLAVRGENLPPALTQGNTLPDHRNEYMRRMAANGPWITGWAVSDDDEGYSRAIAAAGVSTAAYVPLVHQSRVLGVLAVGQGQATGGRAAISEEFPILVEVAEHATTALVPRLADAEARATASEILDTVLERRLYWPVFQPIRDLSTGEIVGYEGLSRFDAPVSTAHLFHQAVIMNRLRDLEVATLQATIDASHSLPPESWLSVNCSPHLLTDTETLSPILGLTQRRVVIELSEHELITDYESIATALGRLGPSYSLAVDDAGAGFASLRHILETRPAYVKLDLALVQGLAEDATRRALVAAMVHFAAEAGFTLIAEGVESKADLRALRVLGVHMGQGFLLGKPERIRSESFKPNPNAAERWTATTQTLGKDG